MNKRLSCLLTSRSYIFMTNSKQLYLRNQLHSILFLHIIQKKLAIMSFQEMSYQSDFLVIFYTQRNLSIQKHFELGFESFSFKFQIITRRKSTQLNHKIYFLRHMMTHEKWFKLTKSMGLLVQYPKISVLLYPFHQVLQLNLAHLV